MKKRQACQECGEEPGARYVVYGGAVERPDRIGGKLYEFGGLIMCKECMDREFGPWDD